MIRARDDGSTEKPATIETALHGAQEHPAAVGHWASPSPIQTDRLDAEPLAAWENRRRSGGTSFVAAPLALIIDLGMPPGAPIGWSALGSWRPRPPGSPVVSGTTDWS